MKFAVLLALHNHPEQANCFIKQMLINENIEVFIHIDGRSLNIENQLIQSEHVHVLPVHFNVSWGDFTQVQYVIELLKYARSFADFDYYSLHTGNDILVRPVSELFSFLETDNKYAYLDCHPLPWKDWQYGGGLGRLALTWPKKFRKRLKPHSVSRYLRSLYGKAYGAGILKGKKLPNIQFYGRSAFFTIRKDCAANIIEYLEKHPEFLNMFETALCGDEIFIDTLVNLTAGEEQVNNSNNLRYIDFGSVDKKNVGAPKTLTKTDIPKIEKSNAFFARKVDLNVDKEIINYYESYCESYKKLTCIKPTDPVRVLNLFTIMDRGGAETMVMNYYRNIDRTKVQFDFLVHRKSEGAYDDEIRKLGGRVYYFPRLTEVVRYNKELNNLFETHKEYKIVHSHMSELGLFAFYFAKKHKIPVRICHAHNAPAKTDLKVMVKNVMKKMMKPLCTHFFSCSREAAEWLYGSNDQVIYLKNAIETEKFSYSVKAKKAVRSHFSIGEKTIVYGHVGRFHEQKNHLFLLEVFKEILDKQPDSLLLLVGDGPIKKQAEEKAKKIGISENVLFLGVRNDVSELMQAMDLMIFPSLYEGLPVTLVEAQCSGLRCLISEQISKEAILIPDLITEMSLERSASDWAKWAISLSCYERHSFARNIADLGFDVKENVKWLEQFYLKEAGNNE